MDKHEIRQDPIREKIFEFLNYVENNRSVLIGALVGIVAIILIVSNIASNKKAALESSSIEFGKAVSNSVSSSVELTIPEFEGIMSSGTAETKSNAFVYLLDYYHASGNTDKVDSLLNLDITVNDDILNSRIYLIKGDKALNDMDYDKAINKYKKAIDLNPFIENAVDLKIAAIYIEKGNSKEAKSIIEKLLEDDDLDYQTKNDCERYLSIINHSI